MKKDRDCLLRLLHNPDLWRAASEYRVGEGLIEQSKERGPHTHALAVKILSNPSVDKLRPIASPHYFLLKRETRQGLRKSYALQYSRLSERKKYSKDLCTTFQNSKKGQPTFPLARDYSMLKNPYQHMRQVRQISMPDCV